MSFLLVTTNYTVTVAAHSRLKANFLSGFVAEAPPKGQLFIWACQAQFRVRGTDIVITRGIWPNFVLSCHMYQLLSPSMLQRVLGSCVIHTVISNLKLHLDFLIVSRDLWELICKKWVRRWSHFTSTNKIPNVYSLGKKRLEQMSQSFP